MNKWFVLTLACSPLLVASCSSNNEQSPGQTAGAAGFGTAGSGGSNAAGAAGSQGGGSAGTSAAGGGGVAGSAGSGANAGSAGSGANAGSAGSGANAGAAGSGANAGAAGSGANAGSGGQAGAAGGSGCPDHLVISEIRSRGPSGGYDCFIELLNPTNAPVDLDDSWSITYRKATQGTSYQSRWHGGPGLTIPAGGHFLLANPGVASSTGYDQVPAPDAWFDTVKVPDAGGMQLVHGGVVVDTVCFYDDGISLADIDDSYACEGSPVKNPHTFSASTNTDESIHRKQDGCQDTGNNESDFETIAPSSPTNAAGQTS